LIALGLAALGLAALGLALFMLALFTLALLMLPLFTFTVFGLARVLRVAHLASFPQEGRASHGAVMSSKPARPRTVPPGTCDKPASKGRKPLPTISLSPAR